MAKKKRIATFLGPQFGLSLTGKHCYAYSGTTSITTAEKIMLDFVTGSETIVGQIQFNIGVDTGSNFRCVVILNGQDTIAFVISLDNRDAPQGPVYIVIPPFTSVQVTGENLSSGASDCFASVTGEIF